MWLALDIPIFYAIDTTTFCYYDQFLVNVFSTITIATDCLIHLYVITRMFQYNRKISLVMKLYSDSKTEIKQNMPTKISYWIFVISTISLFRDLTRIVIYSFLFNGLEKLALFVLFDSFLFVSVSCLVTYSK